MTTGGEPAVSSSRRFSSSFVMRGTGIPRIVVSSRAECQLRGRLARTSGLGLIVVCVGMRVRLPRVHDPPL